MQRASGPNPSVGARRWRRLLRIGVVLFSCCGTHAFAQERVADELLILRTLLASERARVDALEAELRDRREALEALAARVDTATGGAAVAPAAQAPAAQATPASAQASATPAEQPRFDFYGETLVRLATLHQGSCAGCPDRTIGRFRARFGAEGRLAPGLRAVFGVSTGELNDPNSVYQTFGGNLGRKATTFDRAYLVYAPRRAPWVELSAGKFPYPWVRSSMTFDVDFFPEGASERFSVNLQRAGVLRNVSAQALQIVVNEQASAADMLLLGGQSTATFRFGPRLTTRAVGTFFNVTQPDLILRTQLDGTNVGVRNTNALVSATAGGSRYQSAFRYVNVIAENTVTTAWVSMPVTATLELHRNVKAATDRDTAVSLRIDGGRLQRPRDWGFGWHLFHVEQDAIVSALGESDWRAPSNVLQHRLAFSYVAQAHLRTHFTWYRGRTLDTALPGALRVSSVDPGTREPWANRMYFDVQYLF